MYACVTGDLGKRFSMHNEWDIDATIKTVELIYYEAYLRKEDVLKREKYLKLGWENVSGEIG
ncbi:MAG: hypothetical protein KKH94_13470 [Candidatus Omnitrophica bacterium]|nr:hypothetical protein [Candidatus Omnitrophota bacterium]